VTRPVRFSRLAKADVKAIAIYTLQAWGDVQVDHYLAALEVFLQLLAQQPGIGRPVDTSLPTCVVSNPKACHLQPNAES
jgi:toxin ParE1/3/4